MRDVSSLLLRSMLNGQLGACDGGFSPAPSVADVMSGLAVLQMGQQGPAVQMLQQLLNAAALAQLVQLSGMFDQGTHDALAQMQGQMGMEPNGIANALVLAALQNMVMQQMAMGADPFAGRDAWQNMFGGNGGACGPMAGAPMPDGAISARDLLQLNPPLRRGGMMRRPGPSTNAAPTTNASPTTNAAPIQGAANGVQLNVPWFSQFDGSRVERAGNTACYRACRAMARAAGVNVPAGTGDRIQVATGEDAYGRVSTTRDRTAGARNYIDRELAAGRPVTVGVSHKGGYGGNNDGLTDHFVLITGKGTDAQGRTYYTYNDPATTHRGTGQNQRFYVDDRTGNLVHQGQLASGYVANRHTELSMVIRNH